MTYIIIVNYNGWKDTLLCVKSILCSDVPDSKIVIVDNASTNDSVAQLSWYLADLSRLGSLQFPEWYIPSTTVEGVPIHLVSSAQNNGFAAGNNYGVEQIKADIKDSDLLWFLNNDTLITKGTLEALSEKLAAPEVSLVGSKVLDFGPHLGVQTFAGALDILTGVNRTYRTQPRSRMRRLIYPSGVSLAIKFDTYLTIGGFDEQYFLYYEELDLTAQLLQRGKNIAIADRSIVWHKQGASTGSKRNQKKHVFDVEKHKYRSALLFYRKHYPRHLSSLKMFLTIKALKQLIKGQREHCQTIIRELIR